ncbi:protocadherin alpha-2-like [Sinocyclocheilus rhinocerous]|uniref:protocadherin alpha-2-like n=1 Tax=Sinocyclocheilus rhinocerous TaxID=307959 RepID=UPI0007B9EC80|nr:PREDICTED: protocadherin alpha-2-like [Sinocyclocheilus rhinocerous]
MESLRYLCVKTALHFCLWRSSCGKIVYSVSEEVNKGTVVGNIAKDLKISVLESRILQLVSGSNRKYFDLDLKTGALFVNERIDREELCFDLQQCALNLEAVVQNPHSLYRIEINVLDVNDIAPYFVDSVITINITEDVVPGERFHLPVAEDNDIGINTLKDYKLSKNEHFSIDVQTEEQSVSAELMLQNPLDREKQSVIPLVLTAIDGGKPAKTGTLSVIVNVIDINDNKPVFSKPLYKIKVSENVSVGTRIISLTATDLDEGTNSDIIYSIAEHGNIKKQSLFTVVPETGDIVVKGQIDHEINVAIELRVQARDKGSPPKSTQCKVLIEVMDENDNAPEIIVTSLLESVKEDTKSGTAVALVTVSDKDGGKNGIVHCALKGSFPFKLETSYNNHYSLVVDGPLDRESASLYNITITAADEGTPSLSSSTVITLHISDVNDNAPHFPAPVINAFLSENGQAGGLMTKVSADDSDTGENAELSYSLSESSSSSVPITTLININSLSGEIFSLQSFNYEETKIFQFQVMATDSGVPPLSSNATVNVFILESFSDLNLYLLIAIVSVSVIFLLSLVGLIAVKCYRTDSSFSREDAKTGTAVALVTVSDKDGGMNGKATDSGVPPLSSNATVNVFILDENDNSPVILPPYSEPGSVNSENIPYSAEATDSGVPPLRINSENIPYSAEAGYFVAKIRAVDADSGYNALLSNHLTEPKGTNLFRIGSMSDNGEPSLSATMSMDVVVVESLDDMKFLLKRRVFPI